MEYKIVASHTASGLTEKTNTLISDGWQVERGSYNVVETHHQMRFSGTQHKDTIIEREYSLAMYKIKYYEKDSIITCIDAYLCILWNIERYKCNLLRMECDP